VAVNPAGGSGEDEGRDSWCTPKWLADLIGRVDFDPCSNSRSHIRADLSIQKGDGCDGVPDGSPRAYLWMYVQNSISEDKCVFINPPYARGQVIRWVKHWRSTRFIFLLRWDPSTEWFAELIPHCTHVWFPGRRINFEPPPGVKASSNPFPHALYLRNPSRGLLDRLSSAGYLIPIDQALLDFYIAGDHPDDHDGQPERDHGADEEGAAPQGGAGGSGGEARKDVGAVEGLQKWIPAEPKKTKWIVDDHWPVLYDSYQEAPRFKEARKACGECQACRYDLGACFWKNGQEYRDYIRKLQGW
jgi:hypothetical protein